MINSAKVITLRKTVVGMGVVGMRGVRVEKLWDKGRGQKREYYENAPLLIAYTLLIKFCQNDPPILFIVYTPAIWYLRLHCVFFGLSFVSRPQYRVPILSVQFVNQNLTEKH